MIKSPEELNQKCHLLLFLDSLFYEILRSIRHLKMLYLFRDRLLYLLGVIGALVFILIDK